MRTAVMNSETGRLAAAIAAWADTASAAYLTADDVPGASPSELASLSALGAIARAISNDRSGWPAPVRQWAEHAAQHVPADLLARLSATHAHEVLALAYELIVSGPNRRALGTFFTPRPIVDHMITLCSSRAWKPRSVIDPGAGVGAFTQAALTTWTDSRVTAVDINVVTLGLLAATMHTSHKGRLRLLFDNYLSWVPTGPHQLPGTRLVLGNPPYTRHQHLSRADKEIAQASAGALVDSGLAGLSTYFAAASVQALGQHDGLCLLLPGNWCQARYGRRLRQWLWLADDREVRIQPFPAASEVFPGTQVTAMVLYVGPVGSGSAGLWIDQLDLVDRRPGDVSVRVGRSTRLSRTGPCPATFDARPARTDNPDEMFQLKDIARIRRGVATGANKFFFLTDDVAETLPQDVVTPALLKASQVPGLELTKAAHSRIGIAGGQRWLLTIPHGYDLTAELCDYIHVGEERGYNLRHLTRSRPHWYIVEHVDPPDLFVAPFTNARHRIIVNSVSAIGSNNMYGIYLKPQAKWTARGLARWLGGDDAHTLLTDLSRAYQGRSRKIEPGDLAALPVPRAAHRDTAAKAPTVRGRQLPLM